MSVMGIYRQQSAHPLELRDHRHRGRYAFSAFAQMKALDETAFQKVRRQTVGFCTSGPLSFWSRAPILLWELRLNVEPSRSGTTVMGTPSQGEPMKNAYEVLQQKETDLARVRHEIESLRIVASLLSDELPSEES